MTPELLHSGLGAAGTTAIATALWNLILLLRVRRKLGIDSTLLGRPVAGVTKHGQG